MRPLADRQRPEESEQLIGVDDPRILRMLQEGMKRSLILVGPPGAGKTTLARLIAKATPEVAVEERSAVHAGKADLEKLLKLHQGQRLLLVLDEIHRWSKAQQDALLGAVERGDILLIGATTETPYVSLNPALISRCDIVRIERIQEESLVSILMRAAEKEGWQLEEEAAYFIALSSDGDARRALGILESLGPGPITADNLPTSIVPAGRAIDGGMRADLVSAWIKAMRGTDPDAAVWYLGALIDAGEDAVFLARRLVIFASEDVGLADSTVLSTCVAAAQAVQMVGLPEARINLSHACLACTLAPKSNSAYEAINKALADVKSHRLERPPVSLRDAHTVGSRKEGAGKGYRYPHAEGGYAKGASYLPDSASKRIKPGTIWSPKKSGKEAKIAERIEKLRSNPE